MKKLKIISLILSLLLWRGVGSEATAQNLVPNGDFEYYTSCPTFGGQINRAFPWYDPNNSTSDYFNACANDTTNASVPCMLNCFYYQPAHSGSGYSGLLAYANGVSGREYIQVSLNDTLVNNKCYSIVFYANLLNHSRFGVNNIGAYLSNTPVTCPIYSPYNLTPQILSPGNPVITDTINWVKVYGLYNANGGEKYFTIGNFVYDSATAFQIADTSQSAYNVS